MTIKEITNQIYDLSVAGYFNREKFTKERFQSMIEAHTRTVGVTGRNSFIIEIALPDGWWFMEIMRYGRENGRYQYDYYLPETREQEKRMRLCLYGTELEGTV